MANTEPLERELRRGTLDLLVLRILSENRTYGYELVSQLRERSDGLIELKEGTLYPVLYRLEDAKLIAAEWDPPPRGVPRKYYQITTQGRERLEQLTKTWRSWVAVVESVLAEGEEKP